MVSRSRSSYASSTNGDFNYIPLLVIASIFAINMVCFAFCYCNTKKFKKKAEEIRMRVKQEYQRVREGFKFVDDQVNINYQLVEI